MQADERDEVLLEQGALNRAGTPVLTTVTTLLVNVAQKAEAEAGLLTKEAAQGWVSGSTQAKAIGNMADARMRKERMVLCVYRVIGYKCNDLCKEM